MVSAFLSSILENLMPLFGNPVTMAIVVISFFTIVLLASKASKIVILMVLVPLVITLAGIGISEYIGIDRPWKWAAVGLFLIMAFIFYGIYVALER